MASIYTKKNSPVLWIRYKDESGKWKGAPTEYRRDNLGDRRQATLLARRQSEKEQSRNQVKGRELGDWVLPWLVLKYGGSLNTVANYRRVWIQLGRYLEANEIRFANQVRRDFADGYMAWRTKRASRNTAIQDIKIMGMILDEAQARGLCESNPLRKLGLKKDVSPGKVIWTDAQIEAVGAHIQKTGCHWQKVSFFFGLYQACRLRQCQLPLASIRLDLGVIQYPGVIVKGSHGYSQPIDPRFLPILKKLMADAKKQGLSSICTIRWDASLTWRKTLDRLGYEDICHHGLRATWITRAAESGVPESLAMAFCHHSSAEVHRVYKRISTASLVGLSASVPLPAFSGYHHGRPAAGSSPARPNSAEGESESQIPSRSRDRARNRLRFAREKSPGT